MRNRSVVLLTALVLTLISAEAWQLPDPASAAIAKLPRSVRFTGALKAADGTPRSGLASVTFSLYSEPTGGAPVWLETQSVQLDEQGRYSVLLGSSSPEGLPQSIFSEGEARFLGVRVAEEGAAEQPRVALVSVPYALVASDAQTLGGRPASDFVLTRQAPGAGTDAHAAQPESFATSGTAGFIGKFTNTTDLGNSVMFELNGSIGIGTTSPASPLHVEANNAGAAMRIVQNNVNGFALLVRPSTDANPAFLMNNAANTANKHVFYGSGDAGLGLGGGRIGIGTTGPVSPLHVDANNTSAAVRIVQNNPAGFALLVQPGNDGNPAFLMNNAANTANRHVFYGSGEALFALGGGNVGVGTNTPTQKLHVAGQVYSSTGGFRFPDGTIQTSAATTCTSNCGGTISGVTAGNGLSGGGTSGTVSLALATPVAVTNGGTGATSATAARGALGAAASGANSDITSLFGLLTPLAVSQGGTGIAAPGPAGNYLRSNGTTWSASALQAADLPAGSASYVQIDPASSQNGNVDLAGSIAADSFSLPATTSSSGLIRLGGVPFAHSFGNANNTFLGRNAGNFTMTGADNTATGTAALENNTSGGINAAFGYQALSFNTTGGNNTALGAFAGVSPTGAFANTTGSNNTFVGFKSGPGTATQLTNATAVGANAQVTTNDALVLGDSAVSVGIGTTAPAFKLDVAGIIRSSTGGFRFPDGSTQTAAAVGTITGVTAGAGLTGGGTTGAVALAANLTVSGGDNGSATSIARGDHLHDANYLKLTGGTLTGALTGTSATLTGPLAVNTLNMSTSGVVYLGGLRHFHASGGDSVFLGKNAGNLTSPGSGNTGIGSATLLALTTGGGSTAVGAGALPANTTGFHNTAVGTSALMSSSTASENTALGAFALDGNTTGTHNTAVGYRAGSSFTVPNRNSTGSNNTFVGHLAGLGSNLQLDNVTVIGANAKADVSDAVILGNTNVKVGIGTSSPSEKLDVAGVIRSSTGGFKFPDGTTQTTAASTNATSLGGVPATDYARLDTADPQTFAGTLTLPADGLTVGTNQLRLVGGNVGIGAANPTSNLQVVGSTSAANSSITQSVQNGSALTTPAGLFPSAIWGNATATTGFVNAIAGTTPSPDGTAVYASNNATSGGGRGLVAVSRSAAGIAGVFANTAAGKLIRGEVNGVEKFSVDGAGNLTAVGTLSGTSPLATGTGVLGHASDGTGSTIGIKGSVASSAGTAGVFDNLAGGFILIGRNNGSDVFRVHSSGEILTKSVIWGGGGASYSLLANDQNGSIELGGNNAAATPLSVVPYIDFHFGLGQVEDFNFRIMNIGDDRLDFISKEGVNLSLIGTGLKPGVYGATLLGGQQSSFPNKVTSHYGTVTGGVKNQAGDDSNIQASTHAFVGGGFGNKAAGNAATVTGGENNTALLGSSTVGGGANNQANGDWSTVSGGAGNVANFLGTVGGGASNTASGVHATVPGGFSNTAAGLKSFAAGLRAKALHNGAFVWGDNAEFDIASTGANQFVARATGGVSFITAVDGTGVATAGVNLPAGSGAWSTLSDINSKENLDAVDGPSVLARLASVPILSWNYRTQSPSVRHMGPTAQDFYRAFGLGDDDKRISTVDVDGVALAAIQELHRLVQEKTTALEEKTARMEAMARELEQLRLRLAKIEQMLQPR